MKQVCRGKAVPNVLQLLDFFEDDFYFYLVTNYFPLGNLKDVFVKNNNKGVPEETVKVIIRQLVTAL